MKKLFLICVMLIASISYSQSTIQITLDQAKQAIINAQKVESLSSQLEAKDVAIFNLKDGVSLLENLYGNEQQKNKLLQETNNILTTQLEAEKETKKKSTWLRDALIIIGVFCGGFVAGSV